MKYMLNNVSPSAIKFSVKDINFRSTAQETRIVPRNRRGSLPTSEKASENRARKRNVLLRPRKPPSPPPPAPKASSTRPLLPKQSPPPPKPAHASGAGGGFGAAPSSPGSPPRGPPTGSSPPPPLPGAQARPALPAPTRPEDSGGPSPRGRRRRGHPPGPRAFRGAPAPRGPGAAYPRPPPPPPRPPLPPGPPSPPPRPPPAPPPPAGGSPPPARAARSAPAAAARGWGVGRAAAPRCRSSQGTAGPRRRAPTLGPHPPALACPPPTPRRSLALAAAPPAPSRPKYGRNMAAPRQTPRDRARPRLRGAGPGLRGAGPGLRGAGPDGTWDGVAARGLTRWPGSSDLVGSLRLRGKGLPHPRVL
ncbi:proline-rich protein HaeIII subfamily 1-like [Dasypus novemcinctus]|uniref:proline-rich protein HaeIII subfamily 1-like n=1 Tax=Dasypus novemcinctus TaxID=9361 RepID=UPI0039C8EFD2